MKYLVIGTGGTGAAVGGLLAAAGKDLSFVARGAHLEAINKNGLVLDSGIQGRIEIKDAKAFEGKDIQEKYDVIFVCVKSYSLDEIVPAIKAASHEDTIVIPILNMFKTGARLKESLPEVKFMEGCIYISAFIKSPGEVCQAGNVFKLFFGNPYGENVKPGLMEQVEADLKSAGITAGISDDILRDSFKKFSFISAFAATGAYYDISAGAIHQDGEIREFYKSLVREIIEVGKAMGVNMSATLFEEDMDSIDGFGGDIKTSLQRDLEAGKSSEIDTLIFDIVRLGKQYGIPTPAYDRAAGKFSK
ncbi:MAG: 2-dehydropantoate 2-reductase [Clostridiales bacterium]|nr:2-dehydropantoate 2-reductase [Clostridiales bacterium]